MIRQKNQHSRIFFTGAPKSVENRIELPGRINVPGVDDVQFAYQR